MYRYIHVDIIKYTQTKYPTKNGCVTEFVKFISPVRHDQQNFGTDKIGILQYKINED